MTTAIDSALVTNGNTTTFPLKLGGQFTFTVAPLAASHGSVALQRLGPDGTTYLPVKNKAGTSASFTASGYLGKLFLAHGQYRLLYDFQAASTAATDIATAITNAATLAADTAVSTHPTTLASVIALQATLASLSAAITAKATGTAVSLAATATTQIAAIQADPNVSGDGTAAGHATTLASNISTVSTDVNASPNATSAEVIGINGAAGWEQS